MNSEQIRLYTKDDLFFDEMTLPASYMQDEPVRWVMVEGRKYVEGGRADSFYGKGQFAEVVS